MRIAHLTPPSAAYLVPDPAELPGHEDVTVENVMIRVEVPLATDPARLVLKDLVYVDSALQAVADGFDGIFVNTVADYGIDLIRGTVDVPAVGAGEASVAEAVSLAPTFGIVTVWPSSTQIYYDRVLAATGAADRCRSTRFVLEETELAGLGGGAGVMAAAHDPDSSVAARVLAVARDAVDRDGAESIVLGCSCMTRLTSYLAAELPVPVVDPRATGFAATVAAARAGRTSVEANPDTVARIRAAVDVWAGMGDSVTTAWADDCGDVCATVA
ncbi:aspartate/glutamate racemase family protein [Streptomyces brasiliensis]|uniref:Hydantoin racemase n=1 Tax=Streptomyces brasiliensis TaxID=1954 RepID=A0A917UM37_9ACTN|nr:aspartate/glutamate racemase family protein [Streptomyces brasiliensis]GGJ67517.1 hypothetical protein GCM10010121_092780 [Streptomyces brasiliensis]